MKLHRMPCLIKRMIVEELGFDERLFLSFTSKRTCGLLGLFRTEFKDISITINIRDWDISVNVRKPSRSLSERISSINIRSFLMNEWKFNMPFQQHYERDSSAWTMDGSTVQVHQGHPTTMYCSLNNGRYSTSNSVIVFGKLLRHLASVLNIEVCRQCEFEMTIPAGLIPQFDFNLYYENIVFLTRHRMCMTPEDLTLLLENVKTIAGWIFLSCQQ